MADKEGNVVYELCRMPAAGWEHTAFWYEVTEEEFRDYKKHPGHLYGRRINGGELPATTKAPDSSDDVRHPKHYEVFGPRVQVQAIDVIIKSLTPAEFIGYCKGNILKYQLRAGRKDDPSKDLKKAQEYINILDEYLAGLEADNAS